MRERVAKIFYKAGWEAMSRSRPRPRVDVLHHRPCEGGDEMVRICRTPAYVEPHDGYVISETGVLLEDSMDPNWRFKKASWRLNLPSPVGFRSAVKRDPGRVVHYPKVVSLRHWWEWNYYHFYMDVLGKLQLLSEVGIGPEVPLVMGRYVRELGFAEQLLKVGNLAEREWIVPDLENRLIVHADEVIYCQTRQPYRKRLDYLMRELCAPVPDPDSDERVFLTRRPPATRQLSNEAELEPVFRKYGFRTVDAAGMSVQDQMAVFAQARYLVALHGAGVTNIIYRQGAPMGLLELHGRTFSGPGDMKRICEELGYHYADLDGEPGEGINIHADFSITPEDLDAAIQRLLKES